MQLHSKYSLNLPVYSAEHAHWSGMDRWSSQ